MTVYHPRSNGKCRLQTVAPSLSPNEEHLAKGAYLPWRIGWKIGSDIVAPSRIDTLLRFLRQNEYLDLKNDEQKEVGAKFEEVK